MIDSKKKSDCFLQASKPSDVFSSIFFSLPIENEYSEPVSQSLEDLANSPRYNSCIPKNLFENDCNGQLILLKNIQNYEPYYPKKTKVENQKEERKDEETIPEQFSENCIYHEKLNDGLVYQLIPLDNRKKNYEFTKYKKSYNTNENYNSKILNEVAHGKWTCKNCYFKNFTYKKICAKCKKPKKYNKKYN